ncbi:MAG TPA: 4,5-DOPA dioxygenase extradiol [Rhodanobacteraceae bacterium]|nr:4,5-DOPA dioxygenase extradiol [Rhodanobacteraceae bacterium]
MPANATMPVLFVGHGSPMNAIEDNTWRRHWARLGAELPRPRAVLCVSAHWATRGVAVTASPRPETIHDFYGFPPALFALDYPAPGDPQLAADVAQRLSSPATPVRLDPTRGIDHGCWSVLCAMYPQADVPVVQLSLDLARPGTWHYAFARELSFLRDSEVLVLASGNIVHNLPLLSRYWNAPSPPDWAGRFRDRVNGLIAARGHAALCDWNALGPDAALAVPTPEHYLPLLYALALQRDGDSIETFNDDVFATLAMTSLQIGVRPA